MLPSSFADLLASSMVNSGFPQIEILPICDYSKWVDNLRYKYTLIEVESVIEEAVERIGLGQIRLVMGDKPYQYVAYISCRDGSAPSALDIKQLRFGIRHVTQNGVDITVNPAWSVRLDPQQPFVLPSGIPLHSAVLLTELRRSGKHCNEDLIVLQNGDVFVVQH